MKNKGIEAISFLATQKQPLDLILVSRNIYGLTALEYAASQKKWKVAKKLIELGSNPSNAMRQVILSENFVGIENLVSAKPSALEVPNADGDTALMFAIKLQKWEAAKKLIGLGANPSSAMRQVVLSENLVGIENLVVANPSLLETPNEDSDTAFILAIKNQKWEVARKLVQLGANINAKNKAGETPFSIAAIAAFHGYAEGIDILEEAVKNQEVKFDVDAPNAKGDTALMLAIRNKRGGIAEKLVALGANINAKNEAGETPFSVAALQGYAEGIAILLATQNQTLNLESLEARNAEGDTALMSVIKHQRWAVARKLVQLGANINAKNNVDATPVTLAVSNGYQEGIDILKEAAKNQGVKFDVEAPNAEGDTALMLAIKQTSNYILNVREWDSVINLLRQGAEKRARNKKGESPLILLSKKVEIDVGRLLRCGITIEDIKAAKLLDAKLKTVGALQAQTQEPEMPLAQPSVSMHLPVPSLRPETKVAHEQFAQEKLFKMFDRILFCDIKLFEQLLRRVDVNAAREDGATLLSVACSQPNSRQDIIEELLKKGADPNIKAFNPSTKKILSCFEHVKQTNYNDPKTKPNILALFNRPQGKSRPPIALR